VEQPPDQNHSEKGTLRNFVQRNVYLCVIALCAVIASVVFANVYFPDLSTLKATAGGVIVGLFFAGCAAGHRLFDMG